MPPVERVLAVDPGTAKCGLAVVSRGPAVECKLIVTRSDILATVRRLVQEWNPDLILVGGGTGAAEVSRLLRGAALGVGLVTVDERHSSERARIRYFEENPPRGLRRLIPVTLQTPPTPIDDYVAVLLGEEYLKMVEG